MTITKVYTKAEIERLYASLSAGKVCKTPPYALFQIRMSDCVITAYESLKVVFQGEGAAFYSGVVEPQASKEETLTSTYPQAGSDEVGTGDYFGPVVVCAAYVEKKDLELLSTFHIQDSKQIKDEDILKIAPVLIDTLKFSILILNNTKYNQVHEHNNMNQIKAKLHNQAFLNLKKKFNLQLDTIYVDQFTPPKNYFRYLSGEADVVENIHFETKAESKYISVACASIIARYYFLNTLAKMSEKYDFPFPKGAGAHVDEAGRKFIDMYSENELLHVSKFHFANTKKILNEETL
ncbi:ribonuclease HIII [Breznakia sp. PF5-3]|uniref:ribonuclease HIII n=1 Tax=unclassified Breznakia TaxID=2623764 RepID=UPI002406AD37|nr:MULTISPECIES: ribonuclease HIII [unclassified Breznakia]MDF9824052.1 ribonuclease HIII [Breznakia sp. PM6-1]MDF9834882.1 ribonuclease HIII [Breznakia sp. PF5-3]MDF9837096.1 ribonuclease HIII [Breznakia sp. PFB2-8]MDF9859021.1 ribonuclease HIII [Breznakia sp. PH5-24]